MKTMTMAPLPMTQAAGEIQRLSAQLAAANQELDAFTYSIAHDLRAPLRHIAGYVDILQTATGPTLDATNRKHLQTIAQSAAQMGLMMGGLLEFHRVGQAEMNCQRVSLATLVQDARDDLRTECSGRKVDWEIGELPDVQADSALLGQAIGQLLSNAVKFTRPRSPAKIEIGAKNDGTETICFVRDNGAGLDRKSSARLFGVFQRFHPAHEFEGVGVGLAIVRRILQRHGGRIWAEGKKAGGAAFYFSIPNPAEEPA